MRRILFTIFVCLSVFTLTTNILAQSSLDAEFTSPDQTYTVRFPATWNIDDSDDAFVVLSTDGLSITVFSTAVVRDFVFEATTSAEVATSIASLVDFVADDARGTTIGGRNAAITPANYEGEIGAAIVIEMDDDSFGLILVVGDAVTIEDSAELIIRIVANYDTPGIENTSSRIDNRAISLLVGIVETEAALIRGSNDSGSNGDSGGFTAADALRGDTPDSDNETPESDSDSGAVDDSDDGTSAADAIRGAASNDDESDD